MRLDNFKQVFPFVSFPGGGEEHPDIISLKPCGWKEPAKLRMLIHISHYGATNKEIH